MPVTPPPSSQRRSREAENRADRATESLRASHSMDKLRSILNFLEEADVADSVVATGPPPPPPSSIPVDSSVTVVFGDAQEADGTAVRLSSSVTNSQAQQRTSAAADDDGFISLSVDSMTRCID